MLFLSWEALTLAEPMNATLWDHGRSNSVDEIFSPSEVPRTSSQLPTFSTAAKIRVALTVVLFLCSTSINVSMLWSVTKRFQRKPHLRILLMNLAAADLLVTFVVMPLDAVWNVTVQWYAGDLACRLLMFLKLVAMYACSFVTVVISLDRWAAILHPLRVSRAKRKNKAMLCVAWALSFLLAVPQMFVFHTASRSQPTHFIQCATVGSFGAHWQETLYNMFTFSCLFLVPLLVMVLCYSRILIEMSRMMTQAPASPKSREVHLRCSRNNIPQIRIRALKMSAITVLTFVACWTPYYLLGLWYWFSPEMLTREQVPPSLGHIFFLFGLLSTCLDPLVYCFCSSRYRTSKKLAKALSLRMASGQASSMSNGPRPEMVVHWACKPGSPRSPKLAWARKEKVTESCV
ncbi:gonadotropin-releasing hormone II receptor-like [Pantherophis guttatus]|uniref:Gonadotropin-releasing hormone receptor n=1 Tax=Pantherophis guttatus TaxID=94885 RepID=A0A6P9CEQ8_PANGU|nr:gonadotropin-releasing hormone II receptor-like [Pantherophis guttatus]XP_060547844.1 gonadotropin-releasing hormone II receptor-like [Pantherophis guttatus]